MKTKIVCVKVVDLNIKKNMYFDTNIGVSNIMNEKGSGRYHNEKEGKVAVVMYSRKGQNTDKK